MRRWWIGIVLVMLLMAAVGCDFAGINSTSNSLPSATAVSAIASPMVLPATTAPALTTPLPIRSPVPAVAPAGAARLPVAPLVAGLTLRLSTGVNLSPDGKTFASAEAGVVTVRAVPDGRVVRTLTLADHPTFWGWSPDGTLLLGVIEDAATHKNRLALWDAVSGQAVATVATAGGYTSATWSGDSRYVAWTDGFQIGRWDRQAGHALPQPQPTWPPVLAPGGSDPRVGQLAWSPRSSSLAVVQGARLTLWNGISGTQEGTLAADGPITQVAWSPDGALLAGVVADEHYSGLAVVVWDSATHRERFRWTSATTEHTNLVKAVSWLGSGALAVSWDTGYGHKPQVALYNATSGQVAQTLPALADSLVGASDGQTLAVFDQADSVFTLWDAASAPHPTPPPTGIAAAGCPAWQVVAGAPMGKRFGSLRKVVAVTPNDAWAVGIVRTGYHDDSLIEHWDGSQWTAIHHPTITGGAQRFFGLTAVAPHDIWAVGEYEESDSPGNGPVHTLIEHWDGVRWSVVSSLDVELPTPVPDSNPVMGGANIVGAPISHLNAVSAAGPHDVWAVGWSGDNNQVNETMPLIEHWDGVAWRMVPVPGDPPGSLIDVLALAPNDVWMTLESEGIEQIMLHWNGTAWQRVVVLSRRGVALTSLVAVAANDLWALGSQEMAAGNAAAVAVHWDGQHWQEHSPTFTGTDDSHPLGATLVGHDIWAVGKAILHWDGSRWTTAPVPPLRPNDPNDFNYHGLYSVAADGGGLWAVGEDSGGQALVVRTAAGSCATPTPVP